MRSALAMAATMLLMLELVGQEVGDASTLTWSLEGMHRSNAATNGWVGQMLRGGLLDASLLDAMRYDMEAAGSGEGALQASMRFQWVGFENEMAWHPRVGFAAAALADFSIAPDAFGLVFQGNAPDLGEEMNLVPSRMHSIRWNALHLGLGDATGRNYVDVGLYHASWGMDWLADEGKVLVDENIQTLDVSIASDLVVWGENGWGLGLSARQEWGDQTWFATEVHDLGVVRYGKGLHLSIDTSLTTSGLPRLGAGWTIEGIQQDGFGSDIAHWRETREGWQVLPAQIAFQAGHRLQEHWTFEGEVRFGGWMPRPRLVLGAMHAPREDWQLNVELIQGGWGRMRPAFEAQHATERGAWTLRWDDPWGSVTSAGLGRGVRVIWTRNLAESGSESR